MYEKLLQKFENRVKNLKGVIGLFYSGSIASGKANKFSDIDIYLVVDKNNFERILKKSEELASTFGKIKVCHKDENGIGVFIGDDFLKVEIAIIKKGDLKPKYKFKNIKIIKDTNNYLKNLKKKSQKFRIEVSKKEAEKLFFECRDSQIYTARHVARGWKLSAMGEANYHGEQLFYLLAKLKGRFQFGFRDVENFLTKKELEMLKETRCHSTAKKEIQRAMKANWKFMKYIEKYYESVTGNKLRLRSNDSELLKIVEVTYKRAK